MNRRTRVRYVLYSIGVTGFVLLVAEAIVGVLGRAGVIGLGGQNDPAWVANEVPWVAGDDGYYHANPEASVPMSDHPFLIEKGSAFRVFLIGESFLAGVGVPQEPSTVGARKYGRGSIHHSLAVHLREAYPGRTVEVVNASLEAQSSRRMVETLGFVLDFEPDLVVVATCNNEGSTPVPTLEEQIHDLAVFRAFRRLVAQPTPSAAHTPQTGSAADTRAHFESNLRKMASMAHDAGVPMLLMTLPLNLRYDGDEANVLVPSDPTAARLQSKSSSTAPPDPALAKAYPRCVYDGLSAYFAGDIAGAERQLADCPHIEALRWLGLSRLALGRVDEARRLLETYVEAVPRNRCKPSLQGVIRSVATEMPGVTLVDLDADIRAVSPNGLPGPELFVDYCHMNARGQGAVARSIFAAMQRSGWHP